MWKPCKKPRCYNIKTGCTGRVLVLVCSRCRYIGGGASGSGGALVERISIPRTRPPLLTPPLYTWCFIRFQDFVLQAKKPYILTFQDINFPSCHWQYASMSRAFTFVWPVYQLTWIVPPIINTVKAYGRCISPAMVITAAHEHKA